MSLALKAMSKYPEAVFLDVGANIGMYTCSCWPIVIWIGLLLRAECVRTNVVRSLADVVATKLAIILSSSIHLLFFQKGFAYDFEFCYAFLKVTKKIRFRHKKLGGGPPFTHIYGWTAGM